MRPLLRLSLLCLAAACEPVVVTTQQHYDATAAEAGAGDAALAIDATGRDAASVDQGGGDSAVSRDASAGQDALAPWPPGPTLDRTINFQPPGNPPQGAEADSGEVFTALRGYGWNLDLSAATDRANVRVDDLLDTFIVAGDLGRVDRWELVLPEARYLVTVAVGNPLQATGPIRIVAEGEVLIDGPSALRNEYLWVVDRELGVRDGRLTLDVGTGAGPALLNFVRVRAAQPAGGCAARAEVCNGADDNCNQGVDEAGICVATPVCYSASLDSAGSLAAGGFSQRGGAFAEGGFLVDGPGARLERSLGGNFYQGHIAFEALHLQWQAPLAGGASGCLRTVLDLNHADSGEAGHSRLWLASLAPGCGGRDDGVLRAGLLSAFCCLDSAPLPTSDDAAWHSYRLQWTASRVSLSIDGAEVAGQDYSGPSVGLQPTLWFGSAGGSGDATAAVFRNLEVCNTP